MTADWLAARDKLEAALRDVLSHAAPLEEAVPAAVASVFPELVRAAAEPAAAAPTPAAEDGAAAAAAEKKDVWEKQLLEHCFIRVLDALLRQALSEKAPIMQTCGQQVLRLLDAALLLCEQGGVIEQGSIFTLLEQLIEGSTVPDCEAVFGWVELHRSALAAPALWNRGKLILLRTCNELTRRASRAAHPVLCGRVLLLLAAMFPLSERSALNIQGAYNRANVTEWEHGEAAAEGLDGGADAEEGELINVEFYDAFWGLQHYFNYMPSVLPPTAWAKFVAGAELLLDAFEGDPLPEERSSSRRMAPLGVVSAETGTKYLTSSKLLRLELRDAAFRRALLLQLSLLLRYARGPPPPAPPLRGKAPEEAARLAERAAACLAAVPPKGAAASAAVGAAMDRDRHWVAWKAAGCKPFERPPAPEQAPAPAAPPAAPAGGALRRRRTPAAPQYTLRLGSAELDRLWNTHGALGDAARSAERGPPEHLEFLEPIREQLDATFCAENDIEPAFKRMHDKVFCWKALRLVARANLAAFTQAADDTPGGGGGDIEAVTRALFGIAPPPPPPAAPVVPTEAPKAEEGELAAAAEATQEGEAAPTEAAAGEGDAAMADVEAEPVPEPTPASQEAEEGEAPAAADAAAEEEALAEIEAAVEAAEGPGSGKPQRASRKRQLEGAAE